MGRPKLLVVMGPTAAGKTHAAIALAKGLGTEVFSADSRQFYQELNIGVARPDESQLAAVPHHFIAHRSIAHPYTAMQFAQECRDALQQHFLCHKIAVLVGGSGLYIRAVIQGIDDLPHIDPLSRRQALDYLDLHGLKKAVQWLAELDPLAINKIDIQNPRRVSRALEVCLQTGKPFTEFLIGATWKPYFDVLGIEVSVDRAELYRRIDRRVDGMMEQGLLREVTELFPQSHLPVLQTVGYTELFAYLRGETELPRAVELIKQHSRNYAKRQLTWLRNQSWNYGRIQISGNDLSPDAIEGILNG